MPSFLSASSNFNPNTKFSPNHNNNTFGFNETYFSRKNIVDNNLDSYLSDSDFKFVGEELKKYITNSVTINTLNGDIKDNIVSKIQSNYNNLQSNLDKFIYMEFYLELIDNYYANCTNPLINILKKIDLQKLLSNNQYAIVAIHMLAFRSNPHYDKLIQKQYTKHIDQLRTFFMDQLDIIFAQFSDNVIKYFFGNEDNNTHLTMYHEEKNNSENRTKITKFIQSIYSTNLNSDKMHIPNKFERNMLNIFDDGMRIQKEEKISSVKQLLLTNLLTAILYINAHQSDIITLNSFKGLAQAFLEDTEKTNIFLRIYRDKLTNQKPVEVDEKKVNDLFKSDSEKRTIAVLNYGNFDLSTLFHRMIWRTNHTAQTSFSMLSSCEAYVFSGMLICKHEIKDNNKATFKKMQTLTNKATFEQLQNSWRDYRKNKTFIDQKLTAIFNIENTLVIGPRNLFCGLQPNDI